MSSRPPHPPRLIELNADRFEKIVRAHEAFAAGRRGGARAIPRMVVARGMRCIQRQLSDVDFTGADLSGSIFIATDFSRAGFYCANLEGCDFRRANLQRADLRGAALSAAKLDEANLDEADMRAAVLCMEDSLKTLSWTPGRARMVGSSLNKADLRDVVAPGVDFSNCSLRGARLRGANLKHAFFTDADLHGADLSGARLYGVRLEGAILTGMDTAALGLDPAALNDVILDPGAEALARLDDIRRALYASDAWVASEGALGAPAEFDGMDLRPAARDFKGRQLAALSGRGVLAIGLDFSGSQLQGAVFDGADLRGANFTGADLRGVSFRDAKLSHAILRGADLGALDLIGGGRQPVSFAGAVLDGTGIRLEPRAPADAAAEDAPAAHAA
jgi:uncharacterized protein YjbI with pentapeptide repeats